MRGSPARGRIRAQKKIRSGPIRFNQMQRPQQPSRKEILRAQKRNAELERLLARVDKFINGKINKLELATAHHKRCTVLSSLGRHEEALQASQKACHMLKKMALDLEKKAVEQPASRNRAREALVFCWLAIAIYAEGVEHEYLERPSRAENLFAAAISVAKAKLGLQHATTQRLQRLTAHEAPLQKSHMRSQGARKTIRRKRTTKPSFRTTKKPSFRTTAKQRETKQALPNLPATKTQPAAKSLESAALEKSAQQIENMETMLDVQKKKRLSVRKRRQHKKKCEEARALLYAMGQRALFQLTRDKNKSKRSQPEAKTATSQPAEAKTSTTEQSRVKKLISDEVETLSGKKKVVSKVASPIAIKVERGQKPIFFTQKELDTVLRPVQKSIEAANECRDQLGLYPHPHPAGERYWECMLDSDPWGLKPGEAESVLGRLRDSLLELMNQRAGDK